MAYFWGYTRLYQNFSCNCLSRKEQISYRWYTQLLNKNTRLVEIKNFIEKKKELLRKPCHFSVHIIKRLNRPTERKQHVSNKYRDISKEVLWWRKRGHYEWRKNITSLQWRFSERQPHLNRFSTRSMHNAWQSKNLAQFIMLCVWLLHECIHLPCKLYSLFPWSTKEIQTGTKTRLISKITWQLRGVFGSPVLLIGVGVTGWNSARLCQWHHNSVS